MIIKKQLVLDVAGVLLSNLSPSFWQEIATIADVPYEHLKALFKDEIRKNLWTGRISEVEFWSWLIRYCPELNPEIARKLINKHLVPLPAYNRLAAWSQLADIHLLSNHREEWLAPHLKPITPYLKSVTISSQTGYCKPGIEIYKLVEAKLSHSQHTIFVDDQAKNLVSAEELGWNTIIADSDSLWMDSLEKLLDKQVDINRQ